MSESLVGKHAQVLRNDQGHLVAEDPFPEGCTQFFLWEEYERSTGFRIQHVLRPLAAADLEELRAGDVEREEDVKRDRFGDVVDGALYLVSYFGVVHGPYESAEQLIEVLQKQGYQVEDCREDLPEA